MPVRLRVFTDGASKGNPGPAGIGVFIKKNGREEIKHSEYIGIASNNVAEYKAVLKAVELCIPFKPDSVHIYSDSQLVVNQVKNVYKISDSKLKKLYVKLMSKLMSLPSWNIKHITRDKNEVADLLANKAIEKEKNEVF